MNFFWGNRRQNISDGASCSCHRTHRNRKTEGVLPSAVGWMMRNFFSVNCEARWAKFAIWWDKTCIRPDATVIIDSRIWRSQVRSYRVRPGVRFRQSQIPLWKRRGCRGEKQLTLCSDFVFITTLVVVISVVFSGHFFSPPPYLHTFTHLHIL